MMPLANPTFKAHHHGTWWEELRSASYGAETSEAASARAVPLLENSRTALALCFKHYPTQNRFALLLEML
ncbi:hypothetical protein F9L02_03205 [Brucella intermedia]|nr:hypothetical protein F9L02_03205 [Brucella intermedia]